MVPFLDTVSYCIESHLLRVAAAVFRSHLDARLAVFESRGKPDVE